MKSKEKHIQLPPKKVKSLVFSMTKKLKNIDCNRFFPSLIISQYFENWPDNTTTQEWLKINVTTYRPISLLSPFTQIFEKYIHKRLYLL